MNDINRKQMNDQQETGEYICMQKGNKESFTENIYSQELSA